MKKVIRAIINFTLAFTLGSMIVFALALVPLWPVRDVDGAFAIVIALAVGIGLIGFDLLRPKT